MPAPKGNRFWEARSKHGRNLMWSDPAQLKEACYEYFEWAHDNPLEEAVTYQGEVMDNPLPKMRAMSIDGLCVYLGMDVSTWRDYRRKEDFSAVVREVEQIIRTQKFEGASAGILNPNIIARDLGLSEKQEVTGAGGGALNINFIPVGSKSSDDS